MATISPEDRSHLKNSLINLGNVPEIFESFIETIIDWESSRTKSAKRIYATIAVLIIIFQVSSIDYSKLPIFNANAASGNVYAFTICIFVIMAGSGLLYILNRGTDKNIQGAKIKTFADSTNKCN